MIPLLVASGIRQTHVDDPALVSFSTVMIVRMSGDFVTGPFALITR